MDRIIIWKYNFDKMILYPPAKSQKTRKGAYRIESYHNTNIPIIHRGLGIYEKISQTLYIDPYLGRRNWNSMADHQYFSTLDSHTYRNKEFNNWLMPLFF